jgi:aldehyde:ferredoxin oxidoreductase
MMETGGYTGKILRVDLSKGETLIEELAPAFIEKWVGGVGFGARYLYEEVPAGIKWSDPENRIIWSTGPLADLVNRSSCGKWCFWSGNN